MITEIERCKYSGYIETSRGLFSFSFIKNEFGETEEVDVASLVTDPELVTILEQHNAMVHFKKQIFEVKLLSPCDFVAQLQIIVSGILLKIPDSLARQLVDSFRRQYITSNLSIIGWNHVQELSSDFLYIILKLNYDDVALNISLDFNYPNSRPDVRASVYIPEFLLEATREALEESNSLEHIWKFFCNLVESISPFTKVLNGLTVLEPLLSRNILFLTLSSLDLANEMLR
jgi:hypothetical protein